MREAPLECGALAPLSFLNSNFELRTSSPARKLEVRMKNDELRSPSPFPIFRSAFCIHTSDTAFLLQSGGKPPHSEGLQSTVSFSARYLLWLLVPPAAISIPLSFLFIGQVVRLSGVGAATVVLLLMAIYAVVALLYVRALLPRARAVEKALGSGQDASRAMSDALVATERASLIGFLATGVAFVAAATFLVMPS